MVIKMEDPRCTIAAVEMEDLRCRSMIGGVVIEMEDFRCLSLRDEGFRSKSMHDRVAVQTEYPRSARVTIEMEDPRCKYLQTMW